MARKGTLKAVFVHHSVDGEEYYEVGRGGVTRIEWAQCKGSLDWADTICVFKEGRLHSEHPFCNCLGVHYEDKTS